MKKVMPHLTFIMGIVVAVLVYLDDRNPMMGFLKSALGRIYCLSFCLLVIIYSVIMIYDQKKENT